MKFKITNFFHNEMNLARNILQSEPNNQLQRDRLAYAALKLDLIHVAKEFGTSEKLKGLIEIWEKKNR